jgi:hypothetical protein
MSETTSNPGARARTRTMTFGAGVAGLLMLLNTAAAHHSFAIFDAKKSVTLHGVVKQFLWTNPHVFIQLMADAAAGAAATEWSIEMSSPEHLVRAGWKPGTLKSGDPVTLVIHPVRSGIKGGQFVSRVAADGTQIDLPSSSAKPAQESK